jgi:hypothetical protein
MPQVQMHCIEPLNCPYCGALCVAGSPTSGTGEFEAPKKDDLAVCARCENMMVMTSNNTARKATVAELRAHEKDPDIIDSKILIAQFKERIAKNEGRETSQTIN